jgi:membrane fusion protein, multidrug efflux system
MRGNIIAICSALLLPAAPSLFAAQTIPTAAAERSSGGNAYVADGYVEAIRQSALASQVPGRVTALAVKAGDAVKSGQVLVRVDQRAAAQQVTASEAQVAAAQAQMDAARKEYERSVRLYRKQYISQAAMDQAEAQFKAWEAQARAMLAQAGVASTQTSFHAVSAPYSGVVADVTTELGDMAVPGKPLLTVYDPGELRVVANLPERYVAALKGGEPVKLELPGAAENLQWQTARSTTVMPTRDAASHTVQVRLALPPNVRLAPGAYARAHFPLTATADDAALTIPAQAIVHRAELHAVYVADASGKFHLRQVRLGKTSAERVVVLAGLRAGERVALDPVAAAKR